MGVKRGLRALLGRGNRRASDKLDLDDAERTFRQIWHYLVVGSDQRYPLARRQPNALILQMGKVASTSIQAALGTRGINAFHAHGLSTMPQRGGLAHLMEDDLTFRLAAHDLRRHVQHVALHMMTRWYRRHRQYKGRRLKVITLTRDPVTHYPSSYLHRRDSIGSDLIAWHRARLGLRPADPVDEARASSDFMMELASIVVDGRPSTGAAGYGRCMALARERWPEHPVVAAETDALLVPLNWFDSEIASIFGLDMLASFELGERGWTEQSNDWVEILALKFEELPSLVPEIQRFFDLSELTLPRVNVTSAKPGAAEIADATRAVLETPVGQACARELRTSRYGRACGYDRLT
jgi:hypothetical protein